MSNKKFTKNQQEIIDEAKKNLMVSASAGSGKTTVMIERVAKLIESGKTTLDRILVLTFTNNSANDMKKKLYEILSEKKTKLCTDALFSVASADISNIHQFCKKLIQKHFYVCGVDPSFKVASESEALILKSKAFDEVVFDAFSQNFDDTLRLLENNFEKRSFEKIKEMLLSVYDYLNILDDPKAWLIERATKQYGADFEDNEAVKVIVSHIKRDLNFYAEKLDDFLNHVSQFYSLSEFEDVSLLKQNLTDLISISSCEEFIQKYLGFVPKKKDYRKKDEQADIRKEELNPIFDALKKDVLSHKKSFGEESLSRMKEFLQSAKIDVDFLLDLAEKFSSKYAALKKEKFLLDFNDLEKKAGELLCDQAVKKQIQEKYDFCFVDEYQDINFLQESILGLVSKKSKYFGVGDAKQAIYGFRLCSPEIFIQKFEEYKKEAKTSSAKTLNKNFRSESGILNFANKIFDVIMTSETSQIDYKASSQFDLQQTNDKDDVQIYLGVSQKTPSAEKKGVYSVLGHDYSLGEEASSAKIQAGLCANIIANLVEGGADFSDIAILSRSKEGAFVKEFYSNLSLFDIPVIAGFNLNLLEEEEVSLLHNLICLVNNFKDDVRLVKVLTSPIFGFSFNELLEIRQKNKADFFFESFILGKEQNKKVANFLDEIKSLNFISQNNSVLDFAQILANRFGLYNLANLLSEFGGENLEKYFEYINSFGPLSINDYFEKTKNEEILVKAGEGGASQNCVTINTIHSSKGLEYPFVILIGCDRKITGLSSDKPLLISQKLGVGAKAINEEENEKAGTLLYSAIKLSKKQENLAEEIRLLYVALTRAKNKLFLTGTISQKDLDNLKKFSHDKEKLESKTYLELILKSFDSKEISLLKQNKETALFYNQKQVGSCKIFDFEKCMEVFKTEPKQKKFYTPTSQEFEEMKSEISKKLELHKKLTNVKNSILKNNVSALVKNNLQEVEYGRNLFAFEKTSAQSGTMYHSQFAKLKFDGKEEGVLDEGPGAKYIQMFLKSKLYSSLVGKKCLKETPFLLYEKLPKFLAEASEEKVVLQGVFDLLVLEDDGFIVVDYKATHAKDEKITQRYANQLKLYAYAAEKILNKKCKKMLIYKIFDAKVIEIE